jgi:hypothetical protein
MSADKKEIKIDSAEKWLSAIEFGNAKLKEGHFKITFEALKDQRTIQQNRYYRGAFLGAILAWYKDNMVEFFKDCFIFFKAELTTEFLHEIFKFFFLKGQSTTKLDKEDFMEDYIKDIREFYFHNHGLDIPDPIPSHFTNNEGQ